MATINPVWKAYNDFHNEGCEGYNPHEKYIETGNGEPIWSKLSEKAYRLQNLANATSTTDPRWKEITEEVKVLQAAAKAAMEQDI